MLEFWWLWVLVLVPPVILLVLFDILLIFKVPLILLVCRSFQQRKKPTDTSTYYSMCLTRDVDFYLTHMNNTRINSELDVAVYHFLEVAGLVDAVQRRAKNATLWKTAVNVRFRRPITLFSLFKVTTRLAYWDRSHLYLEQQLLTRDKFVRAVSLAKIGVSGVDLEEVLEGWSKPSPNEELGAWITSIESSSKRLRSVGASVD